MIDSHVHLNRREFAVDQDEVLARARAAGVEAFLNVGYDPATNAESVALAGKHDDILATVGIHPHDAALLADEQGGLTETGLERLAELEAMTAHPRVVAVGEIGLDFYRDLSPRPAQYAALEVQMALAERVGLPVVFHVRDAWPQMLAAIDRIGIPARGAVLHSFSGGATEVRWARERGIFLGIGGPVTYKNSKLPAALAAADSDLLLLETDAPWLPPVPHRGQRNESAYLEFTLAGAAAAVGLGDSELAARTDANFRRLFGEMPEPAGNDVSGRDS